MVGHSTGMILKPLIEIGSNVDACWIWRGKISKKTGYGTKQFDGKTLLAHRWVYSIFNGHIPENLVIDHICNTRYCVNPRHLQAISQAENCRRGAGAKLTEAQAKEIKARLASIKWGERQKLADEFGVSAALITDIKYGRAWRGV